MKVKIGNKQLGAGHPCLISLEPGATFSGLEEAKAMIKQSSDAGADAIKFQTFLPGDADRIMGKKDITVSFTSFSGKKTELVYDALKRRELSKDDWKKLVDYAKEVGILFITAPYFPETVEFLQEIKIDALKVSKGDINNVILIEKMAKTHFPIILDAREKLEDIEIALDICKKNDNDNVIIMHCPSGYPAENAGIHLSAIRFLGEKYEYPIGFADHSPGDMMNFAAVAMGASMLEKTITTDKKKESVEHFMSLELNELKNFVKNVRIVEEAIGDPKILLESRVEASTRRSIVAKEDIKKGDSLTRDNIDFWRPGDQGISCSEGFKVLGKKTREGIPKGTFFTWDMLE